MLSISVLWLCIEGSLLAELEGQDGWWGSIPCWLCAKQVPCLLYSLQAHYKDFAFHHLVVTQVKEGINPALLSLERELILMSTLQLGMACRYNRAEENVLEIPPPSIGQQFCLLYDDLNGALFSAAGHN